MSENFSDFSLALALTEGLVEEAKTTLIPSEKKVSR